VLGPDRTQIVPRDSAGASGPATTLVRDAHRAGLAVVPYTFRNENAFLPLELRSGTDPAAYGDAFGEYAEFFRLGVDGLFTDNGDTAVEARDTRRLAAV
jgi:glycerophosphoryl diester phosphodiesterase